MLEITVLFFFYESDLNQLTITDDPIIICQSKHVRKESTTFFQLIERKEDMKSSLQSCIIVSILFLFISCETTVEPKPQGDQNVAESNTPSSTSEDTDQSLSNTSPQDVPESEENLEEEIPDTLTQLNDSESNSGDNTNPSSDDLGEQSTANNEDSEVDPAPLLPAAPEESYTTSPSEEFLLANVYFDFDQSQLSQEARTILEQNADWLLNYPNAEIIIEGHADSRGTNEYNLALGQRRADSVVQYLVAQLGIQERRLKTVSYGEERPVDPKIFRLNRRVQFTQ